MATKQSSNRLFLIAMLIALAAVIVFLSRSRLPFLQGNVSAPFDVSGETFIVADNLAPDDSIQISAGARALITCATGATAGYDPLDVQAIGAQVAASGGTVRVYEFVGDDSNPNFYTDEINGNWIGRSYGFSGSNTLTTIEQGKTYYVDYAGDAGWFSSPLSIQCFYAQSSSSSSSSESSAAANLVDSAYSLQFDDTFSRVAVAHTEALSFAEDDAFTISLWTKYDPVSTRGSILTKVDESSPSGNGYGLYVNDLSEVLFFLVDETNLSENRIRVRSNATIANNQWTHIVASYDGSIADPANRMKLYIDGVEDTVVVDAGTLSGTSLNTDELSIGRGRFFGGTSNYNGFIDDIRIFSGAITSTGITALYGKEDFQDNIISYWPVDDNSGGAGGVFDIIGGWDGVASSQLWSTDTFTNEQSAGSNAPPVINFLAPMTTGYVGLGLSTNIIASDEDEISYLASFPDLTDPAADVDANGSIDIGDLNTVRLAVGTSSGSAGYVPAADLNGNDSITTADVNLWMNLVTSVYPTDFAIDNLTGDITWDTIESAHAGDHNVTISAYNATAYPYPYAIGQTVFRIIEGLGYWPIEEGAGTTLQSNTNIGGNPSITGTINGNVAWTPSTLSGSNYAISPTDDASYAAFDDSALSFDLDTPFTASLWYRPVTVATGTTVLIIKDGDPSAGWGAFGPGWSLLQADQKLGFIIQGLNATWLSDNNPLSEGTFQHVMVSYDGSFTENGLHVYIDGVEIPMSFASPATPTIINTFPVSIGLEGANNLYDEFSLFRGVLDPSQLNTALQLLYNANPPLIGQASSSSSSSGGGSGPIPIAYYPFEEGSGQVVADNYGNDASAIGNLQWTTDTHPTIVPGVFSGVFDGATSIEAAHTPAINFDTTSTFSVSFLWKPPTTPEDSALIGKWVLNGIDTKGWQIQSTASGQLSVLLAGNLFNMSLKKTQDAITPDTWHHIVVTYNGNIAVSGFNRIQIYVDGVLADAVTPPAQNALGTNSIANTGQLSMGGIVNAYMTGNLDDVRIYNQVIVPTDVY